MTGHMTGQTGWADFIGKQVRAGMLYGGYMHGKLLHVFDDGRAEMQITDPTGAVWHTIMSATSLELAE